MKKKNFIYDDGVIACGADGLHIRNYYFPSMRTKHFSWAEIESVRSRPLRLLNGKYRLWGMGVKPCWFNLDLTRPLKSQAIEINTGSLLRSAITPRDPEKVFAIISQRVGARSNAQRKKTKAKSRK